jgi:hypothetical protein
MNTSSFSLQGYAALIREFLRRGYVVTDYADVDPTARQLILRHDIDMDLERALKMAECEAAMGISSNYYVLLRTEMYNVFASRSTELLLRILALGHKIGLHFDASLYKQNREVLETAAAQECSVLEQLTGQKIETITFHRPAPMLQGLSGQFAGRLHGYDPRFFSEIGYCSDSEGRWRFGHPLDNDAVTSGRAIQLVTHPIWWCASEGEQVIPKLHRFLRDRSETLTLQVGLNCKPFKSYLDDQQHVPLSSLAESETLDIDLATT